MYTLQLYKEPFGKFKYWTTIKHCKLKYHNEVMILLCLWLQMTKEKNVTKS